VITWLNVAWFIAILLLTFVVLLCLLAVLVRPLIDPDLDERHVHRPEDSR